MNVTSYDPDFTVHFCSLFPKENLAGIDDMTKCYSYDGPSAGFWHGVAYYLHEQGKSDKEIRDIIASKDARWLLDNYGGQISELGYDLAKKYFKG